MVYVSKLKLYWRIIALSCQLVLRGQIGRLRPHYSKWSQLTEMLAMRWVGEWWMLDAFISVDPSAGPMTWWDVKGSGMYHLFINQSTNDSCTPDPDPTKMRRCRVIFSSFNAYLQDAKSTSERALSEVVVRLHGGFEISQTSCSFFSCLWADSTHTIM